MSETEHPDDTQPLNLIRNTSEVVQRQALGAATSLIDYHSLGDCLIIGQIDQALVLATKLEPLKITVLEPLEHAGRPEKHLTDTGIKVFKSARPAVSGYLGAFSVQVVEDDRVHDLAVLSMTQSGCFDLVLDLSAVPLISAILPPFGYYVGNSVETLEKALAEMPQLVGEFDKPRYFDYNADLCAHSRSNLSGCSRCIDICATDAIVHAGEGVEVNPFLCQGCGSCATVCPSGAMTYAWPRPADAISRTRTLIQKQAKTPSVLLLYAQSDDESSDAEFENTLPDHVLPVAVEEVTAYGLDYWAAMLAAGIQRIFLRVSDDPQDPNTLALEQQASVLESILQGIATDSSGADNAAAPRSGDSAPAMPALVFVTSDSASLNTQLQLAQAQSTRRIAATPFTTHNDKRQTFRMAIDSMLAGAIAPTDIVPLPAGSPFGQVSVQADNCTLCMACVSVCPAGALLDGAELPKLRFVESNCVQCGLCEQACPEQVISLHPRYIVDSTQARESVSLNEEQPFHCVRCNKAFATQKMISTMSEKLAGHWMFKDEKAVRRLRMCEDCRVKDMFEDERDGIEVHRDR